MPNENGTGTSSNQGGDHLIGDVITRPPRPEERDVPPAAAEAPPGSKTRKRRPLPVCLSSALMEWALELPREERARLLGAPWVMGKEPSSAPGEGSG